MNADQWTDAEREAMHEAANALHADACPNDECGGEDMGDFDRQVEVFFDALAEFVAAREAEAWDEGFDAGDQTARAVNAEWPDRSLNPYRDRADSIERGES